MAQDPSAPQQHRHRTRTVADLVAGLSECRATSAQCEEDLTILCDIAACKEVDADGMTGCKQRMAAMGAIEGIIHVLWAHHTCASVQEKGIMALLHLADGENSIDDDVKSFVAMLHLAVGESSTDDDVEMRMLRMVEASALEAIIAGMRLHVSSAAIELLGFSVMSRIATVSDKEARAYCMRRLEAAGAIEATVAALQAHTTSAELHERGFGMLCDMSSGEDDVIANRLQRMVEEVIHTPYPKLPAPHTRSSLLASTTMPASSSTSAVAPLSSLFPRISDLKGHVCSPPHPTSAGCHRGGH